MKTFSLLSLFFLSSCHLTESEFETIYRSDSEKPSSQSEDNQEQDGTTYDPSTMTTIANPSGSVTTTTEQKVVDRNQGDPENGEILYTTSLNNTTSCLNCHGSNAQNGNFRSIKESSDSDFKYYLENGSSPMPAYSFLTAQEMSDIAAYVDEL